MALDGQIIPFPARNIFETSRLVFASVISALAKHRNVCIPDDGVELLANQAVGLMERSDHDRLQQQEPDALARAAGLTAQLIEAWWVAQVRSLMIQAISEHFQIGNAESVADAIKAQVTDWFSYTENGRWPDPAEVAATMLVQQQSIELSAVDDEGLAIFVWGRFRRVEAAREVSPLGWIMISELHRPPEDGPALIRHYTNEAGVMVRVTEYRWQGKVHRPSCDGPALLETDEDGQILRECYVEHGEPVCDLSGNDPLTI